MQGIMQIRPLSPWSPHGKENLKYFTPVARKPTTFLAQSYGKTDLLLNGAVSVTSEVLRNLRYVCQVMETLGWPQLPPRGLPCSLVGPGLHTPAGEAPPVLHVLFGSSSQPILAAPWQKVSRSQDQRWQRPTCKSLVQSRAYLEQEGSETWLQGSCIANHYPPGYVFFKTNIPICLTDV